MRASSFPLRQVASCIWPYRSSRMLPAIFSSSRRYRLIVSMDTLIQHHASACTTAWNSSPVTGCTGRADPAPNRCSACRLIRSKTLDGGSTASSFVVSVRNGVIRQQRQSGHHRAAMLRAQHPSKFTLQCFFFGALMLFLTYFA